MLISTHTLRGERDWQRGLVIELIKISTHTLRGERDIELCHVKRFAEQFQLTRSVGSVTFESINYDKIIEISTHTLRGERDSQISYTFFLTRNFNSHAPWGA